MTRFAQVAGIALLLLLALPFAGCGSTGDECDSCSSDDSASVVGTAFLSAAWSGVVHGSIALSRRHRAQAGGRSDLT